MINQDPYDLITSKVKEFQGALSGVRGVKVIQFRGDDYEPFYVTISNGEVSVNKGIHSNPTLTVQVSRSVLIGLLNRQMDPVQAFIGGLIRVYGDLTEASSLISLISH